MMRTIGCVLVVLMALSLLAQEPTVDQLITKHLNTLQTSQDADSRRGALRSLNGLSRNKEIVRAVPALVQIIKTDPVGEVRGLAIEVLGLIKKDRKEPCPLLLVESIFSADGDVRNYAAVYAGLFKEFEPGALEVVLRHVNVKDPVRRGDVLMWLSIVEQKDPKILAMLRERTRDSHFYVRHCARYAVYRITNRLEDILPYWVEMTAGFVDSPPPELPADAPEEKKQEQIRKNMCTIACWGRLIELVAEYPDDFATLLDRMLRDDSPRARRQTVVALGKVIELIAEAPAPFPFPSPRFAFGDDPKAEETKTPLELLKENFLKNAAVEAKLKQLHDADPDKQVRAAAGKTLGQMAAARKKEPPKPVSPFSLYTTPSVPRNFFPNAPADYTLPPHLKNQIKDGTSNTIIVNPDGGVRFMNRGDYQKWIDPEGWKGIERGKEKPKK